MKSALGYLTLTKFKNQIKTTIKSPSRLIYGIFMIALLVFVVVMPGSHEVGEIADFRDPAELSAILFALLSLMFLMTFISGYSNGAAMFTLSDVNLVFPTPLKPQNVLLYGLFRQLGTSLLVGFFLLFQYSWLNTLYGINVPTLIVIVICYGLTVFFSQYLSMVLYCYTSHSETAKKVVTFISYGSVLILLLCFVGYVMPSYKGDIFALLPEAVKFCNLPAVHLFPVSGWFAAVFSGLFSGNYLMAGMFALLIVATFIILLAFMTRFKGNYYEDVIAAAETQQSAINAQKEGQVGEVVGKNIKVGKEGLGRGQGASAIFYKHLLENRRSGLLIISNISLIFVAVTIFVAVVAGDDMGIIGLFFMSAYMQIFSSMLGRFGRELSKPYIYLIPESPVKKLLYSIGESLVEALVEAVLLFVPIAFIVKADPITLIFCIIGRITYSLLFLSANIAMQRIFGGVRTKGLIMFLFMIVVLVMAVPGVVGAIVFSSFGITILGEFTPLLLGIVVGNILTSVLVLFLCRNVLQYSDLNNI